eukprot:9740040-Lingulodinium_polyedra.AAC.1
MTSCNCCLEAKAHCSWQRVPQDAQARFAREWFVYPLAQEATAVRAAMLTARCMHTDSKPHGLPHAMPVAGNAVAERMPSLLSSSEEN